MLQPAIPPTFLQDHWGDIASVLGILISIVGFVVTIVGVLRSKKAAQRAEEAVRDVKEAILRTDTIMELSAAITIMEEVKRLHRVAAWSVLPDRYSSLKRLLISIRSSNNDLSIKQQTILLTAIQNFSDMERKVERFLISPNNPPNTAKLNEIVSAQLDRVNDVLAALRQQIGVEEYGRKQTGEIPSITE